MFAERNSSKSFILLEFNFFQEKNDFEEQGPGVEEQQGNEVGYSYRA